MNKKLKLLCYLFNNFPEDLSYNTQIEREDMKDYLLEDESVMEGINEIMSIQNEFISNKPISFSGWNTNTNGSIIISGDTVSNKVELTEGAITLGTTKLTEDDLKKIKKYANIH